MKINHRNASNVDILELEGRFDAYEVPALLKWFEESRTAKNVLVNLSGVGFIDSSGLATLVKGLKQCRQNSGELYLCNLQQAVLIIFELTRLDKAFQIYKSEEDAISAFNK